MKQLFRINLELFPGTGVTTVRDLKGTGDITNRRLVIDMDGVIEMLEPDSAALLIIMNAINKKRMVHNAEFDWQEDEYIPMYGDVDGTQTAAAIVADTNQILTLDATMFRVNDLVMIAGDNARVLYVTAVNIGTKKITVIPVDGGAYWDVTDTNKIAKIGNAWEEGTGARDILSTQPGIHDNYCQIQKLPFGATETLDATMVYGDSGKELDRDRKKAGIEFNIEMQKNMLFGQQAKITTGTHPKRFMGGIVPRIQTHVKDMAGAALTEIEWEDYMDQLFDKGSDVKYVYASKRVMASVNLFSSGKLQTVVGATKYGVNIKEYESTHGKVYLVNARKILDEAPWDKMAIGLDMQYLRQVVLKGRDVKLKTNIQNNDADEKKDQYIAETSIETKMEEAHAVLEDVGPLA